MMQSIKIRQRVGQDGTLHLDIPVRMTERDVEVMVIYRLVQPSVKSARTLEQLYGICADDLIILAQDIPETLDNDLAGAFD